MARDRLGKLPAPAELVSIARLQAGAADPLALLVQTGHRLLVLSDEVVHTCEGVRDDGKPGLGRDVLNPPAVEVDLAAVAQCLGVFGSGTQRHRRFSSARYKGLDEPQAWSSRGRTGQTSGSASYGRSRTAPAALVSTPCRDPTSGAGRGARRSAWVPCSRRSARDRTR